MVAEVVYKRNINAPCRAKPLCMKQKKEKKMTTLEEVYSWMSNRWRVKSLFVTYRSGGRKNFVTSSSLFRLLSTWWPDFWFVVLVLGKKNSIPDRRSSSLNYKRRRHNNGKALARWSWSEWSGAFCVPKLL